MTDNAKKRKLQPSINNTTAKRPRFPLKQRPILATTPTATAYPKGELNVARFLRAHENEIKSLERGIKLAKKGLSRRAFQDVPRDLRRRTGSHNPQRVPKRLRARAKKEAADDNTPLHKDRSGSGIGKKDKQKWLRKEGIEKARKAKEKRDKRKAAKDDNVVTVTDDTLMEGIQKTAPTSKQSSEPEKNHKASGKARKKASLAVPPIPPSRFRRRQVHKTWLPTHVWHAKRATMTLPKEPIWRFAIPLTPAIKAYRLTHRAATLRGAVAWDVSYMATISLEGTETAISNLLDSMYFASDETNDLTAFQKHRDKWKAGMRALEGWIYEKENEGPKQIAYAIVIWSVPLTNSKKRQAFIRLHPSAFLKVWNNVIRASKVQKPIVKVEDLRFEIGSIEITGPAAAETLCAALNPVHSSKEPSTSPPSIWPSLASVTDTGMLPNGALLAFSVSDPRLRDPLVTSSLSEDLQHDTQLMEVLADWPIDKTQDAPRIFDRNTRLAAARSLPSQKSINRRKNAAAPGQNPEVRLTDPQIPSLTYVSRKSKTWTILLPWKCVLPIWRCLMRYPISTGGTPRFGGLKERQQVDYERSTPSFPFDYPGTDAGWAWELQQRLSRQLDWTRRPKGKRIEWDSIDLGRDRKGEIGDPWACEWQKLLPEKEQGNQEPSNESEAQLSPFRQLQSCYITKILNGHSFHQEVHSQPSLFTVKIKIVQRGTPQICARIYRLPSDDLDLRRRWLSLMPNYKGADPKRPLARRYQPEGKVSTQSKHARNRALATRLLYPTDNDEKNYPAVPSEVDLIGFVTTGNYNLAEGRPTALANLALHKIIDSKSKEALLRDDYICIIRDAGHVLGRLATWELV